MNTHGLLTPDNRHDIFNFHLAFGMRSIDRQLLNRPVPPKAM